MGVKLCQNCVHSKMDGHIKSGKYTNFIYKCTIHPNVMVLDHWKKTNALAFTDFKEKEE